MLLGSVISELPDKVPQPEHVLEEMVRGGPSWQVVVRHCVELRFCSLGHQPRAEDFRLIAPAERHEVIHRALSPGGRWRAASCTAWR